LKVAEHWKRELGGKTLGRIGRLFTLPGRIIHAGDRKKTTIPGASDNLRGGGEEGLSTFWCPVYS